MSELISLCPIRRVVGSSSHTARGISAHSHLLRQSFKQDISNQCKVLRRICSNSQNKERVRLKTASWNAASHNVEAAHGSLFATAAMSVCVCAVMNV